MQIENTRIASEFMFELVEVQTEKTAAKSARFQEIIMSEKLLEATMNSNFLATKS
jgi:hypothetical protein